VIVTPIEASAQHKIARGEFLLALDKGRRLVHRTLGHHEIDEIPIRQAQHAASVSGGDSEVSQCHDQRLLSSKGSLFPPTTGVAVDIFCGALDPKFARSNHIRSHRNRDALARGKIPCEAKAREADQHHCPG
jgi:hypothetical protein